jgi:protocatechuate 3,4-dioxygenase beta subunit
MNCRLWIVAMAALACGGAAAEVPIVGQPCEGCEAVFQGMPYELGAEARIAPASEPGEPLVIDGVVRRADGSPAAGIVVYAYQTDASGIYPRAEAPVGAAGRRHGRLRGWAKSDAEGRFRFVTVRPAGYPGTTIPQHVHLHVIEPRRCTYYIDDLLFDDDPRLTAAERRRLTGRGGSGVAVPARDADGTWRARRDIVLGENIPGYERCGEAAP